jgi:cobalt-zinc-cadmium efflux system outer membrane protein
MFIEKLSFKTQCGLIAGACLGLLANVTKADALTLRQAIERAEVASPGLQALREQAMAAEARVDGAAALPDPKLQLTYFGESVQTRTGPQESIYSLNQMVPWPKKLSTRKALAETQRSLMSERYELGASNLERDVTHRYVEVAYLEKAVQSTQANLDLIADTYAIVEEQVRGGKSLNALLRLEVERERVSDHMDRLQQQRVEQRERLAAMLVMEAEELGTSFELPQQRVSWSDGQSLFVALESSNPELQALRQRIAGSGEQVQLARLSRYPDFTFGLKYIEVGDEGMAPDAGTDPWAVTVALSLPVWSGKNRAALASAKAERRAIEQMYQERLLQLKAELVSLLARRADNEKRKLRYQEDLIPLAEQALENSRTAYEGNRLSVLELIDSERALLELNLNYWRAVAHVLQIDASIQALTR